MRYFPAPLRLAACLAVFAGLFSATIAAEPAAVQLPAKDKVHVYLLIGQSNMAGRGVMQDEDKIPREGIVMLNAKDQWVPAAHPLHFDKPIAGVGLGLSFAEAMRKANPDVTIALVPSAVGGTPLARWSKDGDLYKRSVRRAKIALESGTLKGILWHQGESDCGSVETANSYGKRLAQMIADLRAELNAPEVPFVAGELGVFLTEASTRPGLATVKQALKDLPSSVKNTATASADGLEHKGDQVHFDRAGLQKFGQRYAEAMQKLQAE